MTLDDATGAIDTAILGAQEGTMSSLLGLREASTRLARYDQDGTVCDSVARDA